jgi:hypothetical protein
VKRIIICIATIVAASGALQASGIIACSGTATAGNPCYASYLPTFNTQATWDSLVATNPGAQPTVNGVAYNTVWDSSGGFVNVAVSGSSLILADDYALIKIGSMWINPAGSSGLPYRFTGSFDSPPDTGFTTSGVGLPVGAYGENLLGSFNPGSTGSFLISTTSNVLLTSFGFRIAAVTSSNFNVTINLFSNPDGTGTQQTLALNSLTGGGNCPSLSNSSGPVPCNNAPFLYVSTTGQVRSFSIQTNDPTGFYIDALDFNTVPEPAPLLFTGAGLLCLAFMIRRKRALRSASRQ